MPKERLLGVQYLRAIAALMVAYFHLIRQVPAYTGYLQGSDWIRTAAFSRGVHVFFVISGFIMYLTAIESAPGQFVWRRIARIVPLYWLLTLSVAMIAIFTPHLLQRTAFSPQFLAKSLAFIPYHNPTQHGGLFPMLVPGWSLNYEMFFYGLFALTLFAPLRWRLPTLLLVLGALWEVGRMLASDTTNSTYTSPLIMLFALGLVLGWLYRRELLRTPAVAATLMVLVGFAFLVSSSGGTQLADFGASTAVVAGAASMDFGGFTPKLSWLALLGDASYSLYLVHLFAFGVTRAIWERLDPQGASAAISFATISMLAAVGMALLTYRFIEKPSLALLTRLSRYPPYRERAVGRTRELRVNKEIEDLVQSHSGEESSESL